MQQLDEVISYNNAICASEKEELGCNCKLCNMCDAILYKNKTFFLRHEIFENIFPTILKVNNCRPT